MKRPVILNSAGKPYVLTEQEQRIALHNEKQLNALGFEIDITTLTTIMKKVSEQKFFQVAPADYLPLRVGEGAWSSNLVTYRSFQLGDDFAKGVLNTGGASSKMASADAGVDSLSIKVKNWGKEIAWSIMDLQMASKAGNWDLVTAKEKARKTNWDQGIQKVAFLGLDGDAGVLGLLNQAGITENLTRIPGPISLMSTSDLKAFCAGVVNDYRANNERTAWPTHFVIPESDYLGLGGQASADFPIKSTLQVLEEMFQVVTMNKQFKILPLAYADAAYNSLGKQMYVLLNYEEESLRMDIPVDYTNTLANSVNNFMFQNVGYGQFTGALAYRPKELIYFTHVL